MAALLIALMALLLSIGVVVYLFMFKPTVLHESPPTSVQTAAPGTTAVRDLPVGACFKESDTAASVYSYARTVDCTKAHDAEVFFTGVMPDGPYPSDDTVQSYVVDHCDPAFEQYVGIPYAGSMFQVFYIFASKDGWDAGNRSLVCYAVDPSGDRTSSVKGVAK